jgi:uncharacterized protein (TIGR02444 family)
MEPLTNTLFAEQFWHFSLALYKKEGVAKRCLILQDDFSCNINVLLFCCLLRKKELIFSDKILKNIILSIEKSEITLKQHRFKRSAAKQNPALYQVLKDQELALEQQQQHDIVETYLANRDSPSPSQGDPVTVYFDRCLARQCNEKQSDPKEHLNFVSNKADGIIATSTFSPPWWANNRHVQTIFPRFFQRRKQLSVTWESLSVANGDVVELAWGPKLSKPKGIVVMFHGLEGNIRSHYANDMIAHLASDNWLTVMMHFRGCAGKPNLTTRAYHSGDTEDALYLLQKIEREFPKLPRMALGVSLGANMLLKLLAENPSQHGLQAAVAISAPLKLAECAATVSKGFSRVYQKYLLNNMKRNLKIKMKRLDYSNILDLRFDEVDSLKTFREFDERVTAPLHGFKNADDYYRQCSSFSKLKDVHCDTLILHAADDPFMDQSVIPKPQDLSPSIKFELSEKGGHVGFLQGKPWSSSIWLHKRVLAYLNTKIV